MSSRGDPRGDEYQLAGRRGGRRILKENSHGLVRVGLPRRLEGADGSDRGGLQESRQAPARDPPGVDPRHGAGARRLLPRVRLLRQRSALARSGRRIRDLARVLADDSGAAQRLRAETGAAHRDQQRIPADVVLGYGPRHRVAAVTLGRPPSACSRLALSVVDDTLAMWLSRWLFLGSR